MQNNDANLGCGNRAQIALGLLNGNKSRTLIPIINSEIVIYATSGKMFIFIER